MRTRPDGIEFECDPVESARSPSDANRFNASPYALFHWGQSGCGDCDTLRPSTIQEPRQKIACDPDLHQLKGKRTDSFGVDTQNQVPLGFPLWVFPSTCLWSHVRVPQTTWGTPETPDPHIRCQCPNEAEMGQAMALDGGPGRGFGARAPGAEEQGRRGFCHCAECASPARAPFSPNGNGTQTDRGPHARRTGPSPGS